MNKFSGIVIDANNGITDTLPGNHYIQEIVLPSDYARVGYTPNLTGFQVFVHADDSDDIPFVYWTLREERGEWVSIDSGTASGIASDENGWVDIEFDIEPLGFSNNFKIELETENCHMYYSTTASNGKLTDESSVPVSLSDSATVSVPFRLLGAVADSGTDLLGNPYRSAVVKRSPSYVSMTDEEVREKSWLSKPNPSKFAVECLYFDIRSGDEASVVNKMLIDTITPGVYFHVYYTNDEGGPWDEMLWTRVPKTFQLDKKKTFTMPSPITANYIKLEFTHLQARSYSPGDHQQKVEFKKHPKWVLDYFYSLYLGYKASHEILSNTISLTYDAFDLYYNYFVDDILESPDYPQLGQQSVDTDIYNSFLDATTEGELDLLDQETVRQIKLRMDTFNKHPLLNGALGSTLRSYGYPIDPISAYSIESMSESVADTDLVSTEDRESVVLDKEFPVMSFYMTCRHYYKVSKSIFENDKAYFVGINQIVFERDSYSADYDNNIYIETAGDEFNIESNDLVSENGVWVAP